MTAPVNDGFPRRDFVEYDQPDGAYTLEAHMVTEDTKGVVPTVGGGTQYAGPGDVLVRRGPNVYDVHTGDAFEELELEPVRDQKELEGFAEERDEPVLFNPAEHNAAEVRRYLRNPNLTDEERQRVEDAERDGQNRSSAFPNR